MPVPDEYTSKRRANGRRGQACRQVFAPFARALIDEAKTLSYFMQPVCLLNADGDSVLFDPIEKIAHAQRFSVEE